ncbi:MAG TPA: 50S ribosomal protein L25 [Candidatus Paceibacterota bacterium]
MLSLSVKERDTKEKPETLRKKGFLPAVFYGRKTQSTPIAVSLIDFKKVFKKAGESGVVTLKTEKGEVDTLIHDIDFDPISGIPRHADFYVFDKDKKMQVDVPVEFMGEAPAVKAGLLVVRVMHEIKVEALPGILPHSVSIDISKLENDGDTVLVKDIPEMIGVKFLSGAFEVVASVQTPKEEKIEEPPVDLSAIEVEKKGKEVAEGEEGVAPTEAAKAAVEKPEKNPE